MTFVTILLSGILQLASYMNEMIGYFSAALIGVSLGLIGGGGSILTVPVMVYLFHLPPLTAISYSLFVVGSTSFVGAYRNYKKHLVHLPTALFFGAASVITVFMIRRFVIPAIPEKLARIGNFTLTFSFLTMVLFALLMLLAAFSMIRNSVPKEREHHSRRELLLHGLLVGLVTGFLGAGGGFLLIPALVLIIGLPMKTAVGTSLLIIAANSFIGFLGDAGQYPIAWPFLLLITTIAAAGIFLGGYSFDKSKKEQALQGASARKLLLIPTQKIDKDAQNANPKYCVATAVSQVMQLKVIKKWQRSTAVMGLTVLQRPATNYGL